MPLDGLDVAVFSLRPHGGGAVLCDRAGARPRSVCRQRHGHERFEYPLWGRLRGQERREMSRYRDNAICHGSMILTVVSVS
jgi:hypothetical protein